MKQQTNAFPMRINGLSVVMMLILLCLCIFGVLSLSTAGAQRNLSERSAQHVAAASRSEADAERLLASVYDAAAAQPGGEALETALRALGFAVEAEFDGSLTASAQTGSQDGLHVALTVTISPGGAVTVREYRLVNETAGGYGDSFTLYGA